MFFYYYIAAAESAELKWANYIHTTTFEWGSLKEQAESLITQGRALPLKEESYNLLEQFIKEAKAGSIDNAKARMDTITTALNMYEASVKDAWEDRKDKSQMTPLERGSAFSIPSSSSVDGLVLVPSS